MRINFHGKLVDEPEIRAGFIGCGSHSFRNIYATFQYAPVNLVATCDLDLDRARAFAAKFGAKAAYGNHLEMLEKERLDAVFIVTGYDATGRPLYPTLAVDCLNAGCHVWIEKPPASSCAEIEAMQRAAAANGRHVVVGMKKMFFPANEKAKELMSLEEFGCTSLVQIRYPQEVPDAALLREYAQGGTGGWFGVVSFLDHLCHPMSLMVYLMGMPDSFSYERAFNGAAMATFKFAGGAIGSLMLSNGQGFDEGMEQTVIVSDKGRHIVVENNIRVKYHKCVPAMGYGDNPNYFQGAPGDATCSWEPEFSLGQLYNKGLFLLGYYNEVNEFARAILDGRAPAKGTLEQALQVTRVFEAFAEGPGREIRLK